MAFVLNDTDGAPHDKPSLVSSSPHSAAQISVTNKNDTPTNFDHIARQTAPNIAARSLPLSENAKGPKNTQQYESASRYGSLPSHMSDINIERFKLDESGNLLIDESIKNIIEFFLMATHIEGHEQAVTRLYEYIEMTLSPFAASQAQVIADNYLIYKDNLSSDQFSMSTDFNKEENLSNVKAALDHKKQVRRQYLGQDVSEALFAHEERYDDFSYQRLTINSNTLLSDSEKDHAMAQAENLLPPKMAQDMRYKREEQKITKRINELRVEEGNAEEIYQLRANFYGDNIAQRMSYLESSSPNWEARVADFYQQQLNIMNQTELSDEEKSRAIKEIKQAAFSSKEQIKLAVQEIRGSIASRE